MTGVNKTLYLPLYGKAEVSRKGIILRDEKAVEIWQKEQFALKGKARSKWLCYSMAMRARVFDDWTRERLLEAPGAAVLHVGCGMDSRVLRVGGAAAWYDADLPAVIAERKKYYAESETCRMLAVDAAETGWVAELPDAEQAVVVMEGLSMYLKNGEVLALLAALGRKFGRVRLLMDVYTRFGAKASKYKNPVNEVGVTRLYGIDDPRFACAAGAEFVAEHEMTPPRLVNELQGFDRWFFARMFAGEAAKKIYRLYEYRLGGR